MGKLSRLAGVLVCSASLAAVGLQASAGVVHPAASQGRGPVDSVQYIGNGWWNDHGVVYHTPHYMGTRQNASRSHPPQTPAVYGGGPVLTTPKMYLILWGFKSAGDPNKLKKLLKSYSQNLGGSSYNNIYTQYTGPDGNIQNPSSQFGGLWEDNKNTIPSSPTDGQVAAESVRGVAHFGYDANASYVVVTAHNHSTSGFGTEFCAYHSATTSGGNLVSYTNLPYIPDAGANCGASIITAPSDETAADEGVTIVEGHEYGESITDPNPPTGWYNDSWGEIGDVCAWTNIQNDPYGSKSYTAQPMFSNASLSCVHSYN
jgi:hypothetical protein